MNPFRSNNRTPETAVSDQIEDPTKGCCFQIVHTVISLFHFIEFTAALALIGYGIAISVYPNDPQHGFAATINSWAVFMFTGSFLGILGVNKDICRRFPLKISAYIAPINALYNLVFLIILIVNKEAVYHYFEQKHKQLRLSIRFIQTVHAHIGYIYFILILLAVFEGLKAKVILNIREELLHYDEGRRRGLLREEEERSAVARRQWERNPAGDSTNNQNDLTTPLMSDTNDSESISHCSKWWEDDTDDNTLSDNNFHVKEPTTNVESEKKGRWLSRLSKRLSSKRESSESSGQMSSNDGESNSFSPIHEDLELQASTTEDNNDTTRSHTPIPRWLEDDKKDAPPAAKDMSWAKEGSN